MTLSTVVEPTSNDCLSTPRRNSPKWLKVVAGGRQRRGIADLPDNLLWGKRFLDICVASCLLVAAVPIVALAAIAIKLSSRGPVFFTQTRVGLNQRRSRDSENRCDRRRQANYGRPFTIFKLRTMHHNVGGPFQTQQNDARIFTVGRLLRRLRIDELPQLINVLKGDMSMVGPRPECAKSMKDVASEIPEYVQRLGLKPGLTGIAQIEYGYANDLASYERKMAYDQLYLENCSLQNDIRILIRTAKVVMTGFGAM